MPGPRSGPASRARPAPWPTPAPALRTGLHRHVLREVSQRTNTKLRHVAEHLVAWAHTQELPEHISAQLHNQLENAHVLHIQDLSGTERD
ncbi:hypothetical protein QFZ75_001222 [Streptomyces sp. V3I8]|uniref:hypothetical protein n=1 Tax=Streptomyces sp. V3I8 TaxID=3042279 RepID=UPI0027877078|nr:hypothetical protein [Streptomyces sp. V3I8]MDQ1034806.1 hypothetical protein [Streptomyces sp. V3I8]